MLQKWLIILFLGLIIQAVSAQNINVHGIITDETGETMIGVSVLVKGTSTGVVTDVNGNFSLSVPKNSVLSISYIGYKSQEISIWKLAVSFTSCFCLKNSSLGLIPFPLSKSSTISVALPFTYVPFFSTMPSSSAMM